MEYELGKYIGHLYMLTCNFTQLDDFCPTGNEFISSELYATHYAFNSTFQFLNIHCIIFLHLSVNISVIALILGKNQITWLL